MSALVALIQAVPLRHNKWAQELLAALECLTDDAESSATHEHYWDDASDCFRRRQAPQGTGTSVGMVWLLCFGAE